MRRILLISFLLSVAVYGDVGYLGSVVQGPVPLGGGKATAVRMLGQDVLIQVDRSTYELTGDFLFFSPNNEGEVFMYFPVDIATPIVTVTLYSVLEPDNLLRSVSVTVDGREVEVFPLFVDTWNPDSDPEVSWEQVVDTMDPFYTDEPDPGQTIYLRRMPTHGELGVSCNEWKIDNPVFNVQSVNAAWKVDCRAGDTLLVEYAVTGDMTTDVAMTHAILCYPLQTGSTWSGSIDRGRVTVVPGQSADMEQITFATGVRMPSPTRSDTFEFSPQEGLRDHPDFGKTRLSSMTDTLFNGALIWEFSDFKPAQVPTGWRAFYPGLGDMFALMADSVEQWLEGLSERKPSGWSGSFIYLYLSDEIPEHLLVISIDGLPLRSSPDPDAPELFNLPVSTGLQVLEWRDDWVLVEAYVHRQLAGEDAGEYRGWVNLTPTDEEGMVLPSAIPLI